MTRDRGRIILLVPAVLILLSWAVAQMIVDPSASAFLPHPLHPMTQLVILRPGAKSDIVSVIPTFVRALFLGGLGVAVSELAKRAAFKIGRYSWDIHFAIVIYQGTLMLDVLRFYVYDWFLYVLHFAGVAPLSAADFFANRRLLPLTSPWPSLIAALLVGFFVTSRLTRFNRSVPT